MTASLELLISRFPTPHSTVPTHNAYARSGTADFFAISLRSAHCVPCTAGGVGVLGQGADCLFAAESQSPLANYAANGVSVYARDWPDDCDDGLRRWHE